VSVLLSVAGVTFSANDDDGNTIVNRNERMSILADAAKATTKEPSSDSDDESTADPSSDSDDESTADPSSDSDDESTADPSSDSDEEGTANPSSDSDDDDKSSSDSDQKDEGPPGFQSCPCGCPRNLVSPPICMRFWVNNPDFGGIGRAGNQCVYNCYKCRAALTGFKFKRVKPTSMKTCPENTDNSKQCLRILRRVVLFQTPMPRRHNGGGPLGASRFQETQRRKMLQSSQQLLPRLHQQGLQRRLDIKC